MRLPYIPDDPQMEKKEDQEVVERVKERRGGKLIALDKALLHARELRFHTYKTFRVTDPPIAPVADGWNSFLKAIRTVCGYEYHIGDLRGELANSSPLVANHTSSLRARAGNL